MVPERSRVDIVLAGSGKGFEADPGKTPLLIAAEGFFVFTVLFSPSGTPISKDTFVAYPKTFLWPIESKEAYGSFGWPQGVDRHKQNDPGRDLRGLSLVEAS